MTTKITREEALHSCDVLDFTCDSKDYRHSKVIIRAFIDQQPDPVEEKTLEEIENEFDSYYHRAIDNNLNKSINKFIKYACQQYAASKDKEIEQLRADLSEMANKLDSNDIPL